MMRKALVSLLVFTLLSVTTPFAFATDYSIELVVPDGKKSKETDAVLRIHDDSFEVIPEKKKFKAHKKHFEFSQLKVADYSYAKKPMLSGGGAVVTALLVSALIAIPFLFVKKKKHWLTVQTEDEFAVLKLRANNYRAILAEFETNDVKINEVREEENDEEKKEKKEEEDNR